jgi:hypothetical protein
MQMPRGNLEGVHVRALTLASVTERMLAHQYHDAMEEAALHRVDLNVLVDFQWPKFVDNVGEFVKQVKADSICDLVSALRPENCLSQGHIYGCDLPQAAECEGMGDSSGAVQGPVSPPVEAGPCTNKVNVVCDALQKACTELGGEHLRSALMCFVRCVLFKIFMGH